ncbi:acyl-[ACP]--phospholipid O-acyltransferase [Piscirickettsia salmonis]|uniref:acyl-[ACP]--phospholipid O-acyltransferase n=1 Tax=Piscirickettsia salmonis TaxID=1238 RepID=UPI001E4B3075|nr:acyl-[ACP]--phospholipid O-acyltransferase [Piscirickettsia salmonis]
MLSALILLPYLMMFTPAGFIADKFSKAKVLRFTAWAAIPLTLLITLFYYQGQFWAAFSMTLLLGIQSAINSPAKYGYVKEFFGKEKIAKANGYAQAITMVAVLASSLVFTLLFQQFIKGYITLNQPNQIVHAIAPLGFILVATSLFEAICTHFLVTYPASAPDSFLSAKSYLKGNYLIKNIKSVTKNKTIFSSIIGLSLFWGASQVTIAVYGAYLKTYHYSALFVQIAMAVAILGIILGSYNAGRVSKNYIETGIIPISTFALSAILIIMVHISSPSVILITFLAYGFFSGMLVVPLNALIQFNAKDSKLGKILAANNFMQNIFMLSFLIVTATVTLMNVNAIAVFESLGIIAFIASILALRALPQTVIRYVLFALFSKFYQIKVQGLKNLPSTGGVLLLGNHISYIDWAILAIASPRPIRFVMDKTIYHTWYLNWLFKAMKLIPISSASNKAAIQEIHTALENGEVIALFPEGHLSRNGQLGKFFTGFERILEGSSAVIIPFYLHGLWGSSGSLSTKHYRKVSKKGIIRPIYCYFGQHLPACTTASILKQKVTELSTTAWSDSSKHFNTLPEACLSRLKKLGKKTMITDEQQQISLSGYKTISAIIAMKAALKKPLQQSNSHVVGLLLPPGIGGILANLASLALDKTVVNLNYTAEKNALIHAVQTTNMKKIITSKVFLKKLTKKGFDLDYLQKYIQFIFLEEIKQTITKFTTVKYYLLAKFMPLTLLKYLFFKSKKTAEDPAFILFSSGSEGMPKGIQLSHHNIMANSSQSSCVLNLTAQDTVLSCLPLFHAFGLTVTTFMPIIEGTPMVCYPDPTDALKIGKTIAKHKITILCGTTTFFNLYSRHPKLHPAMFKSLKIIISGAERMTNNVRDAFLKKFNKNILEGYGATELSPVATLNLENILVTGDWYVQPGEKTGSVGLPLPGTAINIVDPENYHILPMNQEGLILITGPQLMTGYLNNKVKNDESFITIDNKRWYKTGDKGLIDKDGFLTVKGRYSRFAKVAGEMVSLQAIEDAIEPFITDNDHCVAVAIEDIKKGERIISLINNPLTADTLKQTMREQQVNSLLIPSEVIYIKDIPILGSGKVNYAQAKTIALQAVNQ